MHLIMTIIILMPSVVQTQIAKNESQTPRSIVATVVVLIANLLYILIVAEAVLLYAGSNSDSVHWSSADAAS